MARLSGRVLEAAMPARLGKGFRWLLASSWVSNLGDGIALAAGPLLVASQTRAPVLVALAGLLQRLPWLAFGLYAGALADRLDRRLVVVVCDLLRAAVLGVLAGYVTVNQLVGPPLGAFLFAAGMVLPFVTQAVTAALGVVLVARIGTPRGGVRDPDATHVWRDVAEGIRWLLSHHAVRTLVLVIVSFNVTWGAAWSVLVLYATQRLGMSAVGFGLLSAMAAAGALVASWRYGWLESRVPLATLMRGCLSLEVLMHLAFELNSWPWVAMAIMVVSGAYTVVWGTVSQSVRQRAVPTEFQGRVSAVYLVGSFGGIVMGQALGGFIAGHGGLAAPFWFAFAGSGVTLALIWRSLGDIAHADRAAAGAAGRQAPRQ